MEPPNNDNPQTNNPPAEPVPAQPPESLPSTPPPSAPLPPAGVTITPPLAPSPPPINPGVVIGGADGPGAPAGPSVNVPLPPAAGAPKKKRFTKPVKIVLAVVVVLALAAAFYFGYYANPSVIYRQSLKNTGKGYDKLVEYVDKQYQAGYSSYKGSGSYKFQMADFTADGGLEFKGDEKNSQLTFDIGANGTRVDAEIRGLDSEASENPDIYIKASGLKGLGTVLGSPEMDPILEKLDDSWVVIDHTLLDSLGSTYAGAGTSEEAPTREQVLDEAQAFGKVNQEYLFSTNKDKAVLKVVDKIGKENVDGHNTYHYRAALNKDNVKKYIKAQQEALKASKLNSWINKNKYNDLVENMFESMQQSANDIKESDTFDLWVDSSKKVVYKVRFSPDKANDAEEYVDIGLDYRGGDKFPFFITGQTKSSTDGTTTVTFVITVDTQTNKNELKLDVKNNGPQAGTFNIKFDVESGKETIKIDKPTDAKPLAQVLSELGFPELVKELQALDNSSAGTTPPTATPGTLQ